MDNHPFPKKKHPALAAIVTVIFGPLGYLYVGWRYALAGVVIFAIFIIVFSLLLFVPPWLTYVNVLPFAVMAVNICQIRNTIIDNKHPDAFAFNTFPVAIFAMTSLLPILAVVDTAAIGIFMAIQRMLGGEIGKSLFILLLATPFVACINWFLCSFIASAIDRLVLRLVPNAPTNIFPTSVCRRNRYR